MALTHSLTLNDITATITIQDGSYPENVDWILKITDTNKNNASTYGAYAITKTKPVVQETNPDVIPIPNTQSVQIKRITGILKAVEEQTPNTKMVHVKRIAEMLKAVEEQSKKSEKIIYVCILFNYILQDALDFTKSNAKFHKTVVDKCYDMKKEATDSPVLNSLANKILTALSAPLEEVKPVAQEVKPAQNIIDDVILQWAIKEYTRYGTDDWSNLSQKRKDFYIGYSMDEHKRRTELMKSILTKKGLKFDESTMAAYHDWEKYYKPVKPASRYQKMCEFVKTLG